MTVLSPAPLMALAPRDLVSAWLLGFQSHNTRDAYRRDVESFTGFLEASGIFDSLDATRTLVDGWARTLEQRCRPASVARKLASLASFYQFAEDEGLIERSPVAGVRRPRVCSAPSTGLDREQLRMFVAAARASTARDTALALLLACNGLRVSEALGADVGHLSSERGHRTLHISRKGGATATVPLAPSTADAVDGYLAGREDGPLFVTSTGERLDRFQAARVVARIARLAGITKTVSPHTLRHGFVAAALDTGASLRDVQLAAGHQDPKTTTLYDQARANLDSHPTYAVTAAIA